MAKTDTDAKRIPEAKVKTKKVDAQSEYISLDFKGLSLPWAILLGVMMFTAGIGSALYFGLKARPVAPTDGTATITPTPTKTFAATEFPEVSLAYVEGPQIGDEKAKVVILEFSDLVCPYCKQFHDVSYGTVNDQYIKKGKARLMYKFYPLSFHNPAATLASKAAYCVETLYSDAKMFEFVDLFFKNSNAVVQNAYDSQNNPLINIKDKEFFALFSKISVDSGKIKTCMSSAEATARITSDGAELTKFQDDVVAKGLADGLGTPTFVIGVVKNGVLTGRFINGAYPVVAFQNVIEEQLKK
ncbi:hypothetical protein CO112_00270 [Candidatus Dojkabacteria bacterium CG_4_9_14_3_um_filter_150_Dojkabacteria_WS6_41_13]|uniref:Thioredoxin domain-containing protein n=1 Tax=Candidatus Dojkabacteria bacterium CG_4_10_14_0_2_um_filter_Dojkabacteria_WS6_41_15 TaxID=2014249 RepID=A0A2M7W2C2_9BACT|nr:MAG: hypothetical protein COX64_01980 [Candidatus Dojkabacteria bacterium CG_4_10_14_0_2_um_filter_Dojkabacteria_WS6_41_15]PJB23927.1 MAG: hypothetical protein CO112_00270 [Candidatus Dojkabacteria bacterium CG_4_9_14_3_um_filter_150_Dojkabacteria_WS6_41_13]